MERNHILRKGNNMRTKVYKKGLIIGVIFLLIGISMIPITSSMDNVKEKNNQGIVNSQKLNTSDTPLIRHVYKIHFIGRIHNLTIQENDYRGYDYHFESYNLREFVYWRSSIRSWGFSYDHYVGGHASFGFGGYNFRGILRPTFICGYFYVPRAYLS
ncbi:MAG: hypothetical protein NTZ75_04355 [Euryarchaeota archaeon]|nr:hypothetical protein [Euryarchaeota archaeon]